MNEILNSSVNGKIEDAYKEMFENATKKTTRKCGKKCNCEKKQVNEHDVLKRHPLGKHDITDHTWEYDMDTLDGRIAARGKAAELRSDAIDRASYLDNVETTIEKLHEIEEFLDKNENYTASRHITNAIAELEDIILNADYDDRGIKDQQKKMYRHVHINKSFGDKEGYADYKKSEYPW